MSLAETVKALPVMNRRIRLAVGFQYVILAIVTGKTERISALLFPGYERYRDQIKDGLVVTIHALRTVTSDSISKKGRNLWKSEKTIITNMQSKSPPVYPLWRICSAPF